MILLIEVTVLIALSAMFSGLNVGLLSLGIKDLERKAKLGDKRAKRVLPLRRNTHLVLASILLSNVAVISATSLLLESALSGIFAGIVSTLLIVTFGEVLPQAIFAKSALTFTSYLAPFLKTIVVLTYPVAKPLQLLLDVVVGSKTEIMQSRGELGMLIHDHLASPISELDDDEIEIMKNALNLSERTVESIITPLREVFYLNPKQEIDTNFIKLLKAKNYSRVPILSNNKQKCHGILLMKDLVNLNLRKPGLTVMDLPVHNCNKVGSRTALDTMFRKFIASKTHMLLVTKHSTIIGVVTIEDMIESILGHEIEDESDRRRRKQTT
jgi:metal transporter CNNM